MKNEPSLTEVPSSVIANRVLYEHEILEVYPPTTEETLSDKMERMTDVPSSVTLPTKRKYYWPESETQILRKGFARFMEAPQRPKKQDLKKPGSKAQEN